MTRKSIGQDQSFVWKDGRIVYVVLYSNIKLSNSNRVVTVFNNLSRAKAFYNYCKTRYSQVQFDTCRVYDDYTTKGMADINTRQKETKEIVWDVVEDLED